MRHIPEHRQARVGGDFVLPISLASRVGLPVHQTETGLVHTAESTIREALDGKFGAIEERDAQFMRDVLEDRPNIVAELQVEFVDDGLLRWTDQRLMDSLGRLAHIDHPNTAITKAWTSLCDFLEFFSYGDVRSIRPRNERGMKVGKAISAVMRAIRRVMGDDAESRRWLKDLEDFRTRLSARPWRSSGTLYVSANVHDVMAASEGRVWTSCYAFGGEYGYSAAESALAGHMVAVFVPEGKSRWAGRAFIRRTTNGALWIESDTYSDGSFVEDELQKCVAKMEIDATTGWDTSFEYTDGGSPEEAAADRANARPFYGEGWMGYADLCSDVLAPVVPPVLNIDGENTLSCASFASFY